MISMIFYWNAIVQKIIARNFVFFDRLQVFENPNRLKICKFAWLIFLVLFRTTLNHKQKQSSNKLGFSSDIRVTETLFFLARSSCKFAKTILNHIQKKILTKHGFYPYCVLGGSPPPLFDPTQVLWFDFFSSSQILGKLELSRVGKKKTLVPAFFSR